MIKKGCLSCVGLFRFDDDDPEAELERIQEEETKDSDLIQGFFTDHDHKEADIIKKLCVEVQRLMQDLYHLHQKVQDVAVKHDYTIKGMYKHINSVIDKLCQ